MRSKLVKSVYEKIASDTVNIDVPALIRLLEYAREELTGDAGGEKSADNCLHVLATKLINAKDIVDIIELNKAIDEARADFGKVKE